LNRYRRNWGLNNYRQREYEERAVTEAQSTRKSRTSKDVSGTYAAGDVEALSRADEKLYLIANSDGQEYALCAHVTSMSFVKLPTDNGSDRKSVQVVMTVQIRAILEACFYMIKILDFCTCSPYHRNRLWGG